MSQVLSRRLNLLKTGADLTTGGSPHPRGWLSPVAPDGEWLFDKTRVLISWGLIWDKLPAKISLQLAWVRIENTADSFTSCLWGCSDFASIRVTPLLKQTQISGTILSNLWHLNAALAVWVESNGHLLVSRRLPLNKWEVLGWFATTDVDYHGLFEVPLCRRINGKNFNSLVLILNLAKIFYFIIIGDRSTFWRKTSRSLND